MQVLLLTAKLLKKEKPRILRGRIILRQVPFVPASS